MARVLSDAELIATRPLPDSGIDLSFYILTPEQRARRSELLEDEARINAQTEAIAHAAALAATGEVKDVASAIIGATNTLESTAAAIASERRADDDGVVAEKKPTLKSAYYRTKEGIIKILLVLLGLVVVPMLIIAISGNTTVPEALSQVLESFRNLIEGISRIIAGVFG